MRLPIILTMFALLSLTSCATDVANRYYGSTHYAPKKPEAVEVLRSRPKRDFIVIADFQSRGESVTDMREKAAQIGADAVIISILGGYYDSHEEWAGQDRYSNTGSRITGTAIVYK
jgi:hypothetical protein